MMCNVLKYVVIKRNEEADKASNRYAWNNHNRPTLYRLLLDQEGKETPNSKKKKNRKTEIAKYTTSNLTLKSGYVPTTVVSNNRLS